MPKRSSALALKILAGVAAALVAAWGISKLPVLAWITTLQEQIVGMGHWGVLLYPLLFAACNIFVIPGGSLVAVGAGLFFGLWVGALQLLAGNLIAAAVSFFISHKLGRRWLEGQLQKRPIWKQLDRAIEREGWKIVFLSQLHPLFPTSLLNYFYGITRIRFWPCLFWVGVGQLPSCFLYAYLGRVAHLGVKAAKGESQLQRLDYAIWVAGLILSIVLFVALGRLALRLLAQAQAQAQSSEIGEKEPNRVVPSTIPAERSDSISGAL